MKNISLLKVSLFVVIAGLGCSIANATDISPTKISEIKKEAVSAAVNVIPVAFTTFDADKNGSLSKEEINAGSDKSLKLAFDKVDLNADGQLSEDEFNQAIAQTK